MIFLIVVFTGYHLIPQSTPRRGMVQIIWLTGASMVFYGYHIPWLVGLLLLSLLVNGWVSHRLLQSSYSARQRLIFLIIGLTANLGALGFFKYAGLIAATFLPQPLAENIVPALRAIPLPVGISFYTFQGLSLVVDAYWRRREGMESLIAEVEAPRRFHTKVWFYISFFPQLVAGPIIKAHDFVNQIGSKTLRDIDWRDATRKLILGFFLKMVIADNLKEITLFIELTEYRRLSGLTHLVMLYAFSFQIFADFAGYSLIAMGLGRLFGYRFPVNFNFPYISRSITEFWRRWHISLSTWLRDYLYIPLGGNRLGSTRTYLNLFIVMFLGGLWHGAAWSYAIWGSAHGLLLAIERMTGFGRSPVLKPTESNEQSTSLSSKPHRLLGFAFNSLKIFLIFNLVSFLWLLFKLPHFPDVIDYVKALAKANLSIPPQFAFIFVLFSLPVVLYHLWGACLHWRQSAYRTISRKNYQLIESFCLGLLLFFILTNSGTSGAFIYFQF